MLQSDAGLAERNGAVVGRQLLRGQHVQARGRKGVVQRIRQDAVEETAASQRDLVYAGHAGRALHPSAQPLGDSGMEQGRAVGRILAVGECCQQRAEVELVRVAVPVTLR